MSCIAGVKEMKYRLGCRIMRKKRAESYLKTLMSICMAAGKFRFILYRLRVKKALLVLSRLIPYIGRFLLVKRKFFAEIVSYEVELCLTHSTMTRIMQAWRLKLQIIQREWRKTLKYRQVLYFTLRAKWSIAENELAEVRKKPTKQKRSKTFATETTLKANSTIPDEVKNYYIRQHIRQLTQDFYSRMKQHKALEAEIKDRHKKEFYAKQADALLNRMEFKKQPDLPPRPELVLTVTKETLKELIALALSRRLEWRKMF
mmetsp:Transcript_11408/g.22386  ORF Transcript_11408/g.22386 Transcript_11408/m.22386 type:complete len:259 (-) Transcript_11408:113-889(-)